MKLKLVSLAAAALAIVACTETSVRFGEPQEDGFYTNSTIEFSNYVSGMTRASKSGANPFVAGESMGVWGYQTTGEYLDTIFNNQQIDYVSENKWTYTNKKLWNIGSTYKFYGVFPYSTTLYTIGEENKVTFADYVNPSVAEDQIDLMISEMRPISPFNMVDMIFHHIMSNVNISVKVSNNFDTSGVSSITVQKLHLSGIKNTGTYTQTGWTNNNVPVGEWSGQSGVMDIADITGVDFPANGTAIPVLSDFIMMPQTLFTKEEGAAQDVTLDAIFRVHYLDGTSLTIIKNGIRLAGIIGKSQDGASQKIVSWDDNCRYNYVLAFNPQYTTHIWDADGDGSIIIDPETGDTISKNDDTPTPGVMRYDPENPDVILVKEDTDGDGIPDTWIEYPIVWEDIDGDDLLEAGLDRDGDGHIDNVDDDDQTNLSGDDTHDPSDGDPNNPDGKDCILVQIDTGGDGEPDTWVQLEKDPETGEIHPERETDESVIEFTATVQTWDETYVADYEL